MEKLIVLKKASGKTAAVIMLLLAAVLSSCGNSSKNISYTSPNEDFETYLAKKETVPVQVIQKTKNGETLFKVPNRLINDCYLDGKRNYCLVLRKLNKEGKTYLQFVKAELVASGSDYQIVKRLSPGDSFLPAPQKLLPELARKNKLETRRRFLNVQRY